MHLQQQIKSSIVFVWNRMCLWLPVYQLEKNGFTVTLIGRKSNDPYLINLLYGEYLVSKKIANIAVWNINKTIEEWENNSDIIMFRDHGFQPSGAITKRLLTIPYNVAQAAKLPATNSDLLAAFRDPSTVSDINKIRKSRFEYHISNEPAQLEYFYNAMFKPFILSRHRDASDIPSWPSFQRFHEDKELLLISRDGQLVAGALNLQTDDCYTGHVNGVLNADPQLFKEGVVSAIYWFGIIEAHRRGCHTVNLGTARPFLKNGVLAYKKKWGSQIITDNLSDNEADFRILACNNSLVVQRFFEITPFICQHDDRLISLIFLGQHVELNDKDLSSYLRACLFQGNQLVTWLILLSPEWLARKETIESILGSSIESIRIIDLSNGSLSEDLAPLIYSESSIFEQCNTRASSHK